MKYRDVKVKRRGSWLIVTAPTKTDYELVIAHGSMSVSQAIVEFILDYEQMMGKRKILI